MMKKLIFITTILSASLSVQAKSTKQFEKNIESLRTYECPEWFRDAKFGIWSVWGPMAVPMQGDWYARSMYEPHNNKPSKKHVYKYHQDNYGHPSEVGYKDIIPMWKAEKFDPDALMKLYKKAGAKYFVSIANHHDNFDLWDSKYTRWDAVEMGPKRDIVGDWQKAAKKHKMRFGVSEHLSAGFSWWQDNKKSDTEGVHKNVSYDGANSRDWDLYYGKSTENYEPWVTNNGMFAQLWFARISDLLDSYKPDLLYTDGALPFGEYGVEMLSNFYNADITKNKGDLEAVYLIKPARHNNGWETFDPEIAVEDREKGGHSQIAKRPWQTDTSIGDWIYNATWKTPDTGGMYRSPYWVLTTLVDVVSKNGNMLLNVLQRPDGSIDPEVEELLLTIGKWMDCNSEAIFETRPWVTFGEGIQDRTKAEKDWIEDFDYDAKDIRYTRDKADKTLYATLMGIPTEKIVMREVAKANRDIKSISLLGSKEKIIWRTNNETLEIDLPKIAEEAIIPVFKIEWE